MVEGEPVREVVEVGGRVGIADDVPQAADADDLGRGSLACHPEAETTLGPVRQRDVEDGRGLLVRARHRVGGVLIGARISMQRNPIGAVGARPAATGRAGRSGRTSVRA